MSTHYIESHQGEPHVTSDDARLVQSKVLGAGRSVVDGMGVAKSGNNTITVSDGLAIVDGGFLRVQGGELFDVPDGTIGRRRKDCLFWTYSRESDGVESVGWEYVTGEPAANTPPSPANPHPGSILDGDLEVWVAFATVELNGLTVGSPTRLLPVWSWPPSNADNAANVAALAQAVSSANAAAAAAKEAARLATSAYRQLADLRAEHGRILERLAALEARTDQVGAVAAALLGSWFFSYGALYAPVGWVTVADGCARFQGSAVDGDALVLNNGPAPVATTTAGLYTTKAIQGLFGDAVAVADPQ